MLQGARQIHTEPARRRSGRPSKDGSADLTHTILSTAMRLFLKNGYGATSIEEIAATVKMSKGTFYARFPSKAAVFEAAMVQFSESLVPPRLRLNNPDGTLEERLDETGMFLINLALLPESIALERLTIAESYNFPNLPIIVSEKAAAPVVRYLDEFFRDAADRGEIDPADVHLLAEHYMDFMLASLRRAAHGTGPKTADETARARIRSANRIFLNGARRRPGA